MDTINWNGQPITKPGLYAGIPMSAYHGQAICPGPSVSSSILRRMLEENDGSPAHAYSEWSGNPNQIEREETAALVLGRAVHHLMLGQPGFAKEFIIRPDELPDGKTWHGARNDCKKWVAEAEKAGRTILKGDEVEQVKGMAEALGRHKLWRCLTGLIEHSIIWQDQKTGLWLKVRPDAIPTDSGDAADLKTTLSVQYHHLSRTITDYAYHQQASLIRTAFREVLKLEMTSFTFVFIEKKIPHCVYLAMVKEDDLDRGERQNRKALDTMAECLKTKSWPGPGGLDVISHIDLSDWYRTRVDSK
jgi:hypothetical protein